MLYEDIRRGCELYHQNEDGLSYDRAYVSYALNRDSAKWKNPETLDFGDADSLINFCNQWKCHLPRDEKNVNGILLGLKRSVPMLNLLQRKTLLDIKFDEIICEGLSASELIANVFHEIANAGRRYESVATSKMLNAAVNKSLFVMWDCNIQWSYNVSGNGYAYAHRFLPKMQELAQQAINEVINKEGISHQEAVKSFTDHCKNRNSLAKIIDEYNYVKFTLGIPSL